MPADTRRRRWPVGHRPRRRFLTVDNRFLPPLLITLHPDHGASVVRHPGELRAHGDRDRHGDRRRAGHGPADVRQLAAIRRAPTSPASASASWCGRRSSGRTSSCSLISITSKYVLRLRGRHLWNPSNFGLSAVLFLAPDTVSHLSIQWGNVVCADGGDLVARIRDRLAGRTAAHLSDIRRRVPGAARSSGAPSPARRGWQRWRRSPGRCISCSSSSWSRIRRRPSAASAAQCVVVIVRRARGDGAPAQRGGLRAVLRAVPGGSGGATPRTSRAP